MTQMILEGYWRLAGPPGISDFFHASSLCFYIQLLPSRRALPNLGSVLVLDIASRCPSSELRAGGAVPHKIIFYFY